MVNEEKPRLSKEEYYNFIGQMVKAVREGKRMSQKEFANLLGLKSYQVIQKYESGKISIPAYYLKIISQSFNIDIRELLPDV